IVEPEVVEEIPDQTPITFPEVIQAQLDHGRKAAVFPVSESEWLDMGQLSELEKMRERLYGR
ncbi:MAG: nucleotidyltransferase, partial [Oscillospiraceae bacterium]|nr:nucleotidyltransferase [Oscillospiraceae bacterium]